MASASRDAEDISEYLKAIDGFAYDKKLAVCRQLVAVCQQQIAVCQQELAICQRNNEKTMNKILELLEQSKDKENRKPFVKKSNQSLLQDTPRP